MIFSHRMFGGKKKHLSYFNYCVTSNWFPFQLEVYWGQYYSKSWSNLRNSVFILLGVNSKIRKNGWWKPWPIYEIQKSIFKYFSISHIQPWVWLHMFLPWRLWWIQLSITRVWRNSDVTGNIPGNHHTGSDWSRDRLHLEHQFSSRIQNKSDRERISVSPSALCYRLLGSVFRFVKFEKKNQKRDQDTF